MKALLSVAAIAASVLTAAPASAVILGFDDISTDYEAVVPNGYGGFNWSNFLLVHKDLFPGSGYDHGTVSGDFTAVNGWSNPASITVDSGTFSFESAWFTGAWDVMTLTIEGFTDHDNVADFTASFEWGTDMPYHFEAGWNGLQRLTISATTIASDVPTWVAIDDLEINLDQTTEVPEPLTIGLLGMGLLGVAGARRRRRTA
ncbi:MAG TPA: PEP-CTERM sorting domain-containing protein [Pedomonas sp.]|uniref:PEP-CTERM sorting domain-containing protein n=1 Tax=Pedomonas sp. TaxID=2976421 RepID=UPI002F4007AC